MKTLIVFSVTMFWLTVVGLQNTAANPTDTIPVTYIIVEEMPEFPGGEKAFRTYIQENLKYPQTEANVSGTVYVQFIVDKDGTVRNAKVLRGLGPLFDAEALRVIRASPKWQPGRMKRNPVAVQFTVPIHFAHK